MSDYNIPLGSNSVPLKFLLVLSSDKTTPATSKTPTVKILKNSGVWETPEGSISELGYGWYQVAADPDNYDELGTLHLNASAADCEVSDHIYQVVDDLAGLMGKNVVRSANSIIDNILTYTWKIFRTSAEAQDPDNSTPVTTLTVTKNTVTGEATII